MPLSWRRRLSAVALVSGAIVFVFALWAGLQLAARDEQRGFTPEAGSVRAIVVAEVVVVAVSAALVVWLAKRATRRIAILATGVWAIALIDLWFVALAGTIPE